MRSSILFWLLFAVFTAINVGADAQLCDSTQLRLTKVRASETDGNIAWELAAHQIFYHPTCTDKNKLLVYLVGSYDNPTSTTYFPALAANYGYHVVVLKYPNSTVAQGACGSSTDPDCYYKFRKEVIYGGDFSPEVSVDTTNSIVNRLVKLLAYLNSQSSGEGWDQYLISGAPNWSKMTFAGHSQGGGHAALIGLENNVDGVLMFSSPNDYSSYFSSAANWCSGTFATPDSNFFSLNNLQDEVVDFSEQFAVWSAMSFSSGQDSLRIHGQQNPFNNSHLLYIDYAGSGELSENHNATVRDGHTPIASNGQPAYHDVWLYMLGHRESPLSMLPAVTQNKTLSFSDNEVFLKRDILLLEIFDLNGRLILQKTDPSNGERFGTSFFPSGTYFLKATHLDNSVEVIRLLR